MINQATLLGRVGKIETRTTSTGTRITNISMVTSKKIVKDGQKDEKVTWHNVTAFGKLADVAEQYVSIGDLLYIQGEMDSSKYVTKEGQERVKHFIVAHDLKLMPKTKEHGAPSSGYNHEAEVDSELPW